MALSLCTICGQSGGPVRGQTITWADDHHFNEGWWLHVDCLSLEDRDKLAKLLAENGIAPYWMVNGE